ncbi:MAG: hypothetical protein H6765_02575 [Candidatus Peribacteria bacterium]|nr:MAG: hypothetical protein H6765_02575 [Candidatus Peribacteria bacterium]
MADGKAASGNAEKRNEQTEGGTPGPDMRKFSGELLKEILLMQKSLLRTGRLIKPAELS